MTTTVRLTYLMLLYFTLPNKMFAIVAFKIAIFKADLKIFVQLIALQ